MIFFMFSDNSHQAQESRLVKIVDNLNSRGGKTLLSPKYAVIER